MEGLGGLKVIVVRVEARIDVRKTLIDTSSCRLNRRDVNRESVGELMYSRDGDVDFSVEQSLDGIRHALLWFVQGETGYRILSCSKIYIGKIFIKLRTVELIISNSTLLILIVQINIF